MFHEFLHPLKYTWIVSPFWQRMYKAAINIDVQVFLCKYLGVRLLGPLVSICSALTSTNHFPKETVILHFTAIYEFQLLCTLPIVGITSNFFSANSNSCVVETLYFNRKNTGNLKCPIKETG